jgi:anti-sigma regulatory factor (Ser/Thr protein kinase)
MAREIGFDDVAVEEIVIGVSELASNLSRHTRGGMLIFARLAEAERDGIQIEAHDSGPGIADVEQALTDGFSTVGGLGCGLGAINRLMDEFDIRSQAGPEPGTHIVCRRWLTPKGEKSSRRPLAIGVATRAYPGMTANGDTYIVKKGNRFTLVGVIDGLGHGELAAQAAQAARQHVERHFDQPLSAIFRGAGRSCRSTRGVVMALARFDWDEDGERWPKRMRLSFASVGNIEVRVFGNTASMDLRVLRGIVGFNAPAPLVTEHDWEERSVMVMYSDGVRSGWRWSDFPELHDVPAPVAARRLLRREAKDDDDATVVVVKALTPASD